MLSGIYIGELDRRLAFENVIINNNPIGNAPKQSYTDAFVLFGKFVTKAAAERFQSNQQIGVQLATVMIRYTSLVNDQMRFKDLALGQYYYITDIQRNKREGYCIIQGEFHDNTLT